MNSPATPTLRYRREVDGLRAVAVLPVLFYHAGWKTFRGGFVGVDVFFVISGYLISSLILGELASGTFSLVTFYERRARRLLPALLLVMVACVPFAWLWMWPHELASFSQSLAAAASFSSNILFWKTSGYFDVAGEMKPLLHTWSLGVEEQYYLLFPLALALAARLGRRGLAAAVLVAASISFAGACWFAPAKHSAVFYLLPFRLWELLIGVLVALGLGADRPRFRSRLAEEGGSFAGLAMILFAVFAFDRTTPFPAPATLVPALGSAAILTFGSPATLTGRLLGSRLLVGIGLVSYSTYLWHQPLLAFARLWNVLRPSPLLLDGLLLGALGLAYLTWRFVEQPFRNREKIGRPVIFAAGALSSIAIVGLGLAGSSGEGFPSRIPPEVSKILAVTTSYNGEIYYRRADGTDCFRTPGIIGDLSAEPDILLTGDSHAAMLIPPLDAELRKAGRSAYVFADGEIYLPEFPAWYPHRERLTRALERTRQAVLRSGTKTVILAGRWTLKITREPFDNREGGVDELEEYQGLPESRQQEVLEGIDRSLKDLLGSGKHVIFVEPVPETGWLVPEALARLKFRHGRLAPGDASTSAALYDERHRALFTLLDRYRAHPSFHAVAARRFFEDEGAPGRSIVHRREVPLYSDNHHLTPQGAQGIAEEILRLLTGGGTAESRRRTR